MRTIDSYIIEKLKLDKRIKINNINGDEVYATDGKLAEEACKKVNKQEETISKHINGYVYSSKAKLIVKDDHFYVRPDDIKDDEEIHKTSDIGPAFLHTLEKAKLGHLYIIVGYRSSQGETYYYYFFGEDGKIFNDKKEAKSIIDKRTSRYSPFDSKRYRPLSLRYKPMTIKEAAAIPWDRTNHLNDIRFY